MMPWMMATTCWDTSASSCIVPAPAESAPNRSAAGITPMGLFLASSATAIPVKPKPLEKLSNSLP